MRELLRSNDPVLVSFARSVLGEAGIPNHVADQFISVVEGSIGAFPRRLLVADEDWPVAWHALAEAGLENALIGSPPPGRAAGAGKRKPHPADAPADLSDDAFLGGALRILQPRSGYRAGIDAVLLAAAAPVAARELVLDVGAGVGVVGLAVARRVADASVTLVERHPALAALARRNIERNDLARRARAIEADLDRPLGELDELRDQAESFDHALANPPFNTDGRGTAAADRTKAAANAMPAGSLERWARFMAAMVKPGGTATLIHRADALEEVLAALKGRFGGAAVLPLHARAGEPATRILVQAVKGSRASLELQPGLVLHDAQGGFRSEIDAILRGGAGLELRNLAPKP